MLITTRRLIFATILLIPISAADALSQYRTVADPESAHILSITKANPDPSLKVELTSGRERSTLVRNKAKTREAYVLCVPVEKGSKRCRDLVFVKELSDNTVYLISGEPDGVEFYRLIDELKWISNDVLSYERWMGPHFGHRYVINVQLKKQAAAFSLSYFEKEKGGY